MEAAGQDVTFGVNLDPGVAPAGVLAGFARAAEVAGFDLVAIQDHPYNDGFYDTWSLIVYLLAKTERIAFTPNVANLGVRPPAMLAKAGASAATLEPGRIVLGVGAGAPGGGVAGMGGAERVGGDLVAYAQDSMAVLRRALDGGAMRLESDQVSVRGYRAGPVPPARVPVWIGSHRRRMLELTGQIADGWLSAISLALPEEEIGWRQDLLDEATTGTGRDPRSVRRIHNIAGVIGRGQGRGYDGTAQVWVDRLVRFVLEHRFDGFVFWPMGDPPRQAEVFGAEVIPAVREALVARRVGR